MAEDWLLARIRAVEEAASMAQEALGRAQAVLEPARSLRLEGASLVGIAAEMADNGAGPRHDVALAMHEYQHAVTALRADVVRALIDEEGIPLTALARRMDMSRQALTRLYHHGQSLHSPDN